MTDRRLGAKASRRLGERTPMARSRFRHCVTVGSAELP